MEIEDIIQTIIDNGSIEDMHKLSDILEDSLEMLEKYDKECFEKYEMELYEMAYGQNLTDKTKIEWVKTMQPSAKWRVEEAQEIYSKYGIEMPFYSFFVIINMMFSDMNRVLGMGDDQESINKYINATQDWYFDEDATNTQEAKLYNYWKYIVN